MIEISKLGTIELSDDILTKANIGLWAFELDEGKPPRMYVNDTMLGLLGLQKQISPEKTYHAWYDYIDEGSYDLVTEAVEKMASGEHAEVQYPWHHPDGHVMIVRCGGVKNPKYTQGIRIEGTHQDVTRVLHFDEEKIKVENIKRTMNMILSLADEYDPIIVIDPDSGEYDWYLGNANEIEDNTSMSVHGENIYENLKIDGNTVIHEEDREKFFEFYTKENMIKIAETGETQECENRWFVPQRNEYRWKYNKAVRMIDESGMAHIVIGVVDTTEKKEKEEQFQKTQEQLKEALAMAQSANRAKTTFLNNMSHDIRTPMNAIIGYTGLASAHIDNIEQVQSYLEKISQSSDHLLSLINDVLDMSRIESGKMIISEKEESISEIISTLKNIVQTDVNNKEMNLKVDVDIIDDEIICDRLRLNQVLLNVVSNAIKYTDNGGDILVRVRETAVKSSGYATYEFRVKDNGMGMEKEFLSKIFDPFTRVKSTTVSGIQGTGLGMSITKNIIEMMGGSIDIRSEINKGTEVVMLFDFKLQTVPEVEKHGERTESELTVKRDFAGKKVLLVEDNELNREIAVELLEDHDFIVEACEDGTVAVEKIRNGKPGKYDVILMDVQMPVMNGFEATKEIRALGNELSRIPIIAMTANAFEEDRKAALEAGMDEHIAKPINIDMFLETLGKFL